MSLCFFGQGEGKVPRSEYRRICKILKSSCIGVNFACYETFNSKGYWFSYRYNKDMSKLQCKELEEKVISLVGNVRCDNRKYKKKTFFGDYKNPTLL